MKDKFAVTVCRTVCKHKTYLFNAEDKDDAAEQALEIAEVDEGPGWEAKGEPTHSVSGIEYIPESLHGLPSGTYVDRGTNVGDLDEAE